jgi:hypothetical protein
MLFVCFGDLSWVMLCISCCKSFCEMLVWSLESFSQEANWYITAMVPKVTLEASPWTKKPIIHDNLIILPIMD